MATPIQTSIFRRKVMYMVAVLALFTLSIFWRGKLEVPFANQLGVSRWLSDRSILKRATDLELRDLDQGDPDIATSAAQVSLVGSRGAMVTGLWWAAIEKQKKHEWHEFELLAKLVTRLQPHFITPWIFQSWNITYNVSVENDKLGDQYFYIARGIELLAEGDRLNTKTDREDATRTIGSPDIRHQIGFYYQNKFGVSDKVQTLRCLMQLSAIRPPERDPNSLINATTRQVDPVEFRKFCEKNPQLVRRLRNKLNCALPEDVVQFLRDNRGVPSVFTAMGEPAKPSNHFPILPPTEYFPIADSEYTVSQAGSISRTMDDTFDAFHAARSWFSYANAVVPPSKLDWNGNKIPWASPRPGEYDQFRYRVPRAPALIIFKIQPARAQSYLAERLAKEGWFDETSSWNPDERSGANTAWFTRTGAENTEISLKTPATSKAAWDAAFRLWDQTGQDSGLYLEQERLQAYAVRGRKVPTPPGVLPPDYTPAELEANGITQEDADSARAIVYYDQNRNITNFAYFRESSLAERDDVTISARKLLWDAEEARLAAENTRAVRLYVAGLARWREALATFPNFHRPDRSEKTEEDTYELELTLVNMLKEEGTVRSRADRVAEAYLAVVPMFTAIDLGKADVLQAVAEDEAIARVAADSIESIFPKLSTAGAEQGIVRRVNRLAESTQVFGSSLAIPLVRTMVLRSLIDNEYAWVKEFKLEPKFENSSEQSDYWVRPYIREMVKSRMNLVRKVPPPQAEVAAEQSGDAPGPLPTRVMPGQPGGS